MTISRQQTIRDVHKTLNVNRNEYYTGKPDTIKISSNNFNNLYYLWNIFSKELWLIEPSDVPFIDDLHVRIPGFYEVEGVAEFMKKELIRLGVIK